ncbi:sensor domain-containing diguanylate cyclase [Halomonas sp. E19]|uniref:sensor domain-containing diguanylate cyclase n=1 Tax=unclassified Halomonas TaxID=2609666 RepID=UPI004033DD8B
MPKHRALPRLLSGAISWLLLLLMLLPLQASAAIDASLESGERNLGPEVWLLEDAGRKLSIETILASPQGLAWQASRQNHLNFSFSTSAWWVRFEVLNDSPAALQRLLELAMPLHDYLDAWVVDAQGQVVQSWHTGNRLPFDSRPVAHRTFVLPLELPPGERRQVVLRLDTHDGLFDATPLYLMSPLGFLERAQRELMAFSFYFGALLALLIYNLLLYLATRERLLLIYVVYLGAFFLLMFIARGYAFQYWWPDHPTFNNQIVPLNIGVFAITLAMFSDAYLGLRRHAPRLAWAMYGMAGLCLVSALPALLGHYAPVLRGQIPSAIALALLLLGLAAWRSIRGDTLARIFLLAWSVLLVGVGLYFLRVAGLLPYNLVTEYAVQAGSGLEFLLLALGLAWKFNRLKNDRLLAQQQAHDMQRQLNERLEEEVRQRTRELEKANRQLASLAQTDPLTGLMNRRTFEATINEELKRRERDGKPLLFAMMDVDDFKLFNDSCGHQAGDHVLVEVAGLLRSHFRRTGDRLFRLGGEEFGLLLEAESFAAGHQALERFRQALAGLEIVHPASRHGVITGSFGLVYTQGRAHIRDAMVLYREADQAMYEAKEQGRNRIVAKRFLATA